MCQHSQTLSKWLKNVIMVQIPKNVKHCNKIQIVICLRTDFGDHPSKSDKIPPEVFGFLPEFSVLSTWFFWDFSVFFWISSWSFRISFRIFFYLNRIFLFLSEFFCISLWFFFSIYSWFFYFFINFFGFLPVFFGFLPARSCENNFNIFILIVSMFSHCPLGPGVTLNALSDYAASLLHFLLKFFNTQCSLYNAFFGSRSEISTSSEDSWQIWNDCLL